MKHEVEKLSRLQHVDKSRLLLISRQHGRGEAGKLVSRINTVQYYEKKDAISF